MFWKVVQRNVPYVRSFVHCPASGTFTNFLRNNAIASSQSNPLAARGSCNQRPNARYSPISHLHDSSIFSLPCGPLVRYSQTNGKTWRRITADSRDDRRSGRNDLRKILPPLDSCALLADLLRPSSPAHPHSGTANPENVSHRDSPIRSHGISHGTSHPPCLLIAGRMA
jgi:hypothetical protein